MDLKMPGSLYFYLLTVHDQDYIMTELEDRLNIKTFKTYTFDKTKKYLHINLNKLSFIYVWI